MLTFLLDEYKARILRRYRLRLFTLHLGLLGLVLLVGAALAVPQFALLASKRDAALVTKTASTGSSQAESNAIKAEVKAIKSKLAVIRERGSKEPITMVLERALAKRGEGITITTIALARGGNPGSIVIGGVAKTRDALVSFSKRLQGEPSFTSATLPVSALAKNKDILFSISIDSKF